MAAAGPVIQGPRHTLPLPPTFEEDGSLGESSRFFWKNSQIIADFAEGAGVGIRSADGARLQISFPGASTKTRPKGENRYAFSTFYYSGETTRWHSDEHFERIRYPELYPGIDLVFFTSQNELQFNFELAAGADPMRIRIRYDGVTPKLLQQGDLEVGEGALKMVQQQPQALEQQVLDDGSTRLERIPCHYRIQGREASIELGSYDRSHAVIIDPILIFSTYLGGSAFDVIYGATADASGNIYVTGETSSGSLRNPSLPMRSSSDAFIAKLNSNATQVLYLVYLGGRSIDYGTSISVDPSGNAYITGVTESSDFPVTHGAFLTTAPGPENAFVVKVNSIGQVQYSTYLGGSTSASFGYSIAVDASGAAYVTGTTQAAMFPVTSGVFQTGYSGGVSDCFISKLNSSGSGLVYSTLLGGNAGDMCSGIAVDGGGNAYVTGTTYSGNFPMKSALQGSLLGSSNAFVTKINSAGTAMVYSTYLGGSGADFGNAISVDSSGSAYIVGQTSSTDFPVTSGVFQTTLNGIYNAFLAKLSVSGTSFVYSTLLGGSGIDTATAVAVDSLGKPVIAGYTDSPNFSLAGAIQSTLGGGYDAFATVMDTAGATLVFSSYFGGSGDDRAYTVVSVPGSMLYLAGTTDSSNFPTAAALQPSLSVPYDAFALEVSYTTAAVLAPVSVTPSSGTGSSQTFAFAFSDSAGASDITAAQIGFNSAMSGAGACWMYYAAGTRTLYLANDAGSFANPGLALGNSGTLQNSQCTVNISASSASAAGNTLTVNLSLTFAATFAGTKNVYLYVQNATQASGFVQEGTWTIPAAAGPAPVSATPNSGTGLSQTFAFVFSDPAGASDITAAQIGFNNVVSTANACWVSYAASTRTVSLANNAGSFANPGLVLGTSGTLQNGQCTVNIGASSASASGNTLTVNLSLTFTTTFAGTKNVYLYVQNATQASSYVQEGTWTIPVATAPAPVSVTPSSGAASSQTFAFAFSDSAGASDITAAQIGFNTVVSGANACWMYYAAGTRMLYLANDAGSFANPGLVLGSSGTLLNSQCTVNISSSSTSPSGNTLTVNLSLVFAPAFAGTKNVYLYVQNATQASNFIQEGTWTIPAATGPAPVSVTPSSGTGLSQTFAFVFSDSAGASDITAAQIGFNTGVSGTDACWMYYAAGTRTLYLTNNAGSFANTGLVLGTSGTLQNSQCTVNIAASSASAFGNTLTINLVLTFTAAFAGTQNIYLYVQNATQASSFVKEGTWTVP